LAIIEYNQVFFRINVSSLIIATYVVFLN